MARRVAWPIFAVVTAACLTRGVGAFVFDASTYWAAASWFVPGQAAFDLTNFLSLRGVWTVVTFAPAALLTWVAGAGASGFAVLLQNSIVIGWVAAFLLPRAIAPWRTISTKTRWIAGGLCWLALVGFAPYPLVDIYAVIAVCAAVVLLNSRKVAALIGAGALLTYAINIRPAYIPVVILLVLVTVLTHRWRFALLAPGTLLTFAPQVAYNWIVHARLALSPIGTDGLAGLQAGYASYVVRYDTALGTATGRQFFCSPQMASSIGTPPDSTLSLLEFFFQRLPESAMFALEKVAAAIHWPLSIPYTTPNPGVNGLFAAAITLIAVSGCVYLVAVPITRRVRVSSDLWGASARALAVIVATIITIVGSASEARFALPLVVFGLVGSTGAVDSGVSGARAHKRLLIGTGLIVIAVLALGYVGLAHPAPPGDVTPAICAAT